MRTPHHGRRPGERRDPYAVSGRFGSGAEAVCNITGRGYGSPRARGRLAERLRYFCAALRPTKVLPPFILLVSGASLIWITTASASTPRFFTNAWVISRIIPAFCSSVRPAAMLTVISGMLVSPFALSTSQLPQTLTSSPRNGFAVIARGARPCAHL